MERHRRGEDGVRRRAGLVDEEALVPFPETETTIARIYEGL